MVLYECFRCGYNTKLKGNMNHHLNRKNICNPIEDNVEINEIKKYYGFDIETITTVYKQEKPVLEQEKPVLEQVKPVFEEIFSTGKNQEKPGLGHFSTGKNQVKPGNILKEIKCKYCNKCFTRQYGLTCHLKLCKKKVEAESLVINQNEEIIKMKKEIEELKNFKIQTQNNTTNNTNSYNTTNNTININNYGNENIKHLRSKDFAGLLQGIYGAVPNLIKKIHFDPKHPENQNIKFTNKKLPYLKIMKNDKWQLVNKKHELLDLIDSKCYMLKEKYYSILEKKKYNITEVQRDKIEKFMKQYNEEDKKMMLDLIERTELMLLNNS